MKVRKKAEQGAEQGKWPTVLGGVLVVAMLGALFFFVYPSRKVPSNADYEGTIVDRWADYTESEQGSHPRLRLVVESQDGKQFTVKVDPNVYESARVGMRIKSRSGQIVLVESDRNPTGSK